MILTAAALAVGFQSGLTLKLAGKGIGIKPLAYAAAPTGSKFAVSIEGNDVRIMDANGRKLYKTFKGHPQPAYAIAYSDDGTFLASGDESARIFIWNIASGQKTRTIIGHIRGIGKLSFNHTRTLLASTGKDDVVNIWNVSNGKKAGQILGNGINLYGATFHPLRDLLLVGSLGGGGRTYLMTPAGAKLQQFITYTSPYAQLHGMLDTCWSPDGTKASTAGNDNFGILWDMKTFKRIGLLKGDTDWVVHVAFSPNGKYVATSSTDRTVRVYDCKTLQKVAQLDDESSIGAPIAFTADGKYLLSAGVDDNMEIYSVNPPQGPVATKKK